MWYDKNGKKVPAPFLPKGEQISMRNKIFAAVISFLLIAILAVSYLSAAKFENVVPSNNQAPQTVPEEVSPEEVSPKVTLMIYMIGSDLESKSASATTDMEEMAASGIDTSAVNLLVLSGGSEKWHNGLSPDEITLQLLTKDGFTKLNYKDTGSMGEAGCLQRFLDYSYENYKTDKFDLILWDHGNGPLIGYGKDTLNNNDSLTLTEMRQALSDSHFGADNKLGFIGFDACLMASAELVLAVHDYADYLIASQEIEPVFGWNYSFLKDCAQATDEELAREIADCYKKYSEEYFAEKEFLRSPVTMSVVDLSKAGDLETSIDEFFAVVSKDVSGHYSQLAKARTEIKSPGRGSTGSEYDFVDLMSMADAMSDDYKDQASKLKEALSKAIIYNVSSEEDYCGLSFYYPFYNKNYYRRSWHDEYLKLGMFSDYTNYLARFDQIWLGSDYADYFETLNSIKAGDELNSFTLELTPEQQQYYLKSGYYIMRKFVDPNDGHEEYSAVYYSAVTDYDDGVITADYNGKALFFVTDYGEKVIPLVKQTDYNDGVSEFFSFFTLCNEDFANGGGDDSYKSCEMHFSYDSNTDKVTVDGIYEMDDSDLSSGKKVPVDPKDWVYYRITHLPSKRLTRNDNGTIKDYFEWDKGDWMMWNELSTLDNVRPSYEPLYDDGSEYFIMFDIGDVQGGRYCSEMFPIILAEEPGTADADVTELTWSGEGVTIFDDKGVKAELKYSVAPDGKIYMYLGVENSLDNGISMNFADQEFNGRADLEKSYYFAEKKTDWRTVQDLTKVLKDGENTYEFTLGISDSKTRATYARQRMRIIIPSSAPKPDRIISPVMGASATEQVLTSDDDLEIKLDYLGFYAGTDGRYYDDTLSIALDVKNKTQDNMTYCFEGVIVNGVYIHQVGDESSIRAGASFSDNITVQNGTIQNAGLKWSFIYWSEDEVLPQIDEISSIIAVIKINDTMYLCEPKLKDHAPDNGGIIGDDVLYEDDTIKVVVAPGGKTNKGESIVNLFNLWIINKTDRYIVFKVCRSGDSTALNHSDIVEIPGGYAASSVIVNSEDLGGKWPKYYIATADETYKSEDFEVRY